VKATIVLSLMISVVPRW